MVTIVTLGLVTMWILTSCSGTKKPHRLGVYRRGGTECISAEMHVETIHYGSAGRKKVPRQAGQGAQRGVC